MRSRMGRHKVGKKLKATPSRKEPEIGRKISQCLGLGEDVLEGAPLIMGYGMHRLCIENYRHIIEYTGEIVRIQTKKGRIHITGEHLTIAYYREDAMCIIGDICSIIYYP